MLLHVFNPDNDMALANGEPGYTPPASIQKMMHETALLPARWAEVGDGVLVGNRVWIVEQRAEKQENWEQALGDALLKAVEGRGHWANLADVLHSMLGVRPWGWSPALCHRLRSLGIPDKFLLNTEELAQVRWLSCRERAVEMLAKIRPELPFLKGESVYCRSEEEVQIALNRWSPSILKAPWSSSGKGLRFRLSGADDNAVRTWYTKLLKQQGGVVVEPFYDKVMDFAMEFLSDGTSVQYQGLSLFETHPNGAYKGNRLWTEEEKWKFMSPYLSKEDGLQLIRLLEYHLHQLIADGYRGPLGVDMMILKDGTIHPCVEINMRMTMGYAALLYK